MWTLKNNKAVKQRLKKLKLTESVALTNENRNMIGYNYLEFYQKTQS
jgi:hypothetical protein